MGFIWSIIVGAIIGALAGAITNNGQSMGWIANIIAGLLDQPSVRHYWVPGDRVWPEWHLSHQ